MAAWLRRDLLLVHVSPVPDRIGYGAILLEQRYDSLCKELVESGKTSLAKWLDEKRVTGVQTRVIPGPIIPALLELCREMKAPLMALGSRRTGILKRIVVPSVASEVAACAAIPIAIVPPD
jgi:nucleotide-binding universal stress UspA family protein